nr:PREDICTED: UPF0160 protein [Bemisia tabaci]
MRLIASKLGLILQTTRILSASNFFVSGERKLSVFMEQNNALSHLKSLKTPVKIGTHDGTFHCDEALGCYLLKILRPDAQIHRSRDQSILDTCDVVIDVGGVFDVKKLRFDHHQREFNESFGSLIGDPKWTIKLSSAGLVYTYFGKEILKKILGNEADDQFIETVFHKIYEGFIQEVDGVDNGVPMFEGEPLYQITTGLSKRVHNLNKEWNDSDDFNEMEAFEKAMELTGSEFKARVIQAWKVWWPARSIVINAINHRFKVHESGEIIELEKFCPWKEHLFELEKELDLSPSIKYVIFNSGSWRVQAVSVNSLSFVLRIALPEEWRGLRDEELSAKAGIKDCVFVHGSGFIGGNKNRDGALEMAVKALKIGKSRGDIKSS